MKTILDPIHLSLIKQSRTLQTINRSANATAGAGKAELKKRHAPDLKSFDGDLPKLKWFDIYPSELEDFGGMGIKLMRFGVEHIEVDNLTDPNAENPCRAYAYTPDETEGI